MCSLKPVKKLIVPNKKCLKQYFLKREIKTLSLCFPICHLFTCWTWAIHLDRALRLNLAFTSVNEISKYMYFEQAQIYYSTNILFLLNTNVFPEEKKSKCVVLQISHIEDFPVMPSGLKQTYFGGDNLTTS